MTAGAPSVPLISQPRACVPSWFFQVTSCACSIGPVTREKLCGVTRYAARGGRVIDRTSQKQIAAKTTTITRTNGRNVLRIREASLVRGDIQIDYEGTSPN